MSSKLMYENLIAFHPGSYVEDIIEDLNITQKELTAHQLEFVLGIKPITN